MTNETVRACGGTGVQAQASRTQAAIEEPSAGASYLRCCVEKPQAVESVGGLQADPLYIGIFVSSMLFPALASIIKEKIFAEAKEKLDGKPLDIFVVNSFGSGAQAVGVLLLLPVLTSLRGLSLSELPQYVGDGELFKLTCCWLQKVGVPAQGICNPHAALTVAY